MNQANLKQEEKTTPPQNTNTSLKNTDQKNQERTIPEKAPVISEESTGNTPDKRQEPSQLSQINNINNKEDNKVNAQEPDSKKSFTTGQDITSRSSNSKYDTERMNNHIQNLIKEKKAHLKKIANLEDQVNQLKRDLSENQTRVPKTEKMIDIFSTAQENAEKYFDNIKNLADTEMENAKKTADETISKANEKAQQVLSAAEKKALYIQEKASEQALELQKKNGIMMQETERYKSSIEAQLNEAKAKIETSENQAVEKAERIIIKAKEDAANILTEANMKLELANKKHDQIIFRAEDQVEHIVSCARTEYEGLRSLIDKSSLQYIELCKELSDFDYLYSFTETINTQSEENKDDSESDSIDTKEN